MARASVDGHLGGGLLAAAQPQTGSYPSEHRHLGKPHAPRKVAWGPGGRPQDLRSRPRAGKGALGCWRMPCALHGNPCVGGRGQADRAHPWTEATSAQVNL